MNWKRIGSILLVAFLAYFLIKSPVESANAVRNVFISAGRLANTTAVALTTFLQTLF